MNPGLVFRRPGIRFVLPVSSLEQAFELDRTVSTSVKKTSQPLLQ